jgi:hypothetical protein
VPSSIGARFFGAFFEARFFGFVPCFFAVLVRVIDVVEASDPAASSQREIARITLDL